ncbi:hypothetical protein BTH42_28645 [Burkholderia sp. SRS-W-2-2016]|nr:hypothetical protein BTH42_28645 [Burkholderia sp. SRS-W-2-2016]
MRAFARAPLFREVTDTEWQLIAPLLPELQGRVENRGRPGADARAVFNGMLWVLYSRSSWHAMPDRYPSFQTCHRRYRKWYDSGALKRVTVALSDSIGHELYELIRSRTAWYSSL